MWNAVTGRLVRTLEGPSKSVQGMAFSRDGRVFASLFSSSASYGSGDMIVLWDPATGRHLRTLQDDYVAAFAFAPDGRTLATAGSLAIKQWDVATARLLKTSEGHTSGVSSVVYSPDGRFFASGASDRTARIWDAATGRLVRSLNGYLSTYIESVSYSPDGRTLAAGGQKGVALWSVETGAIRRTIDAGDSRKVIFSPSGHVFSYGNSFGPNPIREWDPTTGDVIRAFDALPNAAARPGLMAVSPDGRRLISGGDQDALRVWRIDTGELLTTTFVGPDGEWLTITPEGFFDASEKGSAILSVVQGLNVYGIDQFYQALYRPDLVREKLAADPRGLVRGSGGSA
jgi:WD40 repeat protein